MANKFLLLKDLQYILGVRLPTELEQIIYDDINGMMKSEMHEQLTKCMNFEYQYNPLALREYFHCYCGLLDAHLISFHLKDGNQYSGYNPMNYRVMPIPYIYYIHPSEPELYQWDSQSMRVKCLKKNIEYSNSWGW